MYANGAQQRQTPTRLTATRRPHPTPTPETTTGQSPHPRHQHTATATMAPLRVIHCGSGGRAGWPIALIARMQDTAEPPFVSVALVDTDKPPNDGVHAEERPTGADNLAKAREVSGLGEDVCFLNKYNPGQGLNPREGMDADGRAPGSFDVSGLEAALAAVECDVVAVITPPDTHAPCALAAVRAGKHIMVEKPFCKTLKDAAQIVEEAEKAGVKVMVLQNDRYRSGADEIHQLVKEGKIGQPYFGLMTRYGNRQNPHHSGEDDHAYLWERGIHDFDSICHLFDSKPKKVFADSFNPPWSPYKGGGGVHAWIEFESGARCGFLTTFMNQKVGSVRADDCMSMIRFEDILLIDLHRTKINPQNTG